MSDKVYEKWEKETKKITAENKLLLDEFKIWLENKNLKTNTIKTHLLNMDFYVNNFLLRYETIKAKDGATSIGSFLGDYFIRKAMWSSKNSMKQNISSFKKFYAFMNEKSLTTDEDLKEMKNSIRDEGEFWLDDVDKYWAKYK